MEFERAYVISLRRNAPRYQTFLEAWEPIIRARGIPAPERIDAIDGKLCNVPFGWVYREPNWYRGVGAWGCYRTHLRIIEDLLNREQYGPTLILEDDAFPVENFCSLLATFAQELPTDWDQLYLGGQHLVQPLAFSTNALIGIDVNRTHTYVVRGREFLLRLYQIWSDWRAWPNRHYLDHAMAWMQREGRWGVYTPAQWLVGQHGGYSECTQDIVEDRLWATETDTTPKT